MIAGVVLAAGESSRMGTDKPLLAYGSSTFLETIVASLREAGISRILVVLGHHAREIQQNSNLEGVEVVINPEYRAGQTSSLKAGLQALLGSEEGIPAGLPAPPEASIRPEIEGMVLCLADHPAVRPATFLQLVRAFQASDAPVVIPTHHGRRGHPVLIASPLFGSLLGLASGEGADTVIRRYRDTTHFLEVADPGVVTDVDDPAAYRRLLDQSR